MGCVGVASWVANIAEEKPKLASAESKGKELEEAENGEGEDDLMKARTRRRSRASDRTDG